MRFPLIPCLLIIVSCLALRLTGAPFQFAGTYFGTFENERGEWALLVRPDQTLEFIGYLPDRATLIRSYPYSAEIDAVGRFSDPYASGGQSLAGTIVNGRVAGTFLQSLLPEGGTPFSVRFSGEVDTGRGGSFHWPEAGFLALNGPAPATVPAYLTATVGPSGRVMIAAGLGWVAHPRPGPPPPFPPGTTLPPLWLPATVAGASGILDASGRTQFDGSKGSPGSLSIDVQTGAVRATLDVPGMDGPFEYTGVVPVKRLLNVSTRGLVGEGDGGIISGFVIAGSGTKRVLVRAIGPSLTGSLGVAGALSDPRLALMRDGTVIDEVDNWGASGNGPGLMEAMARVGAFQIPIGSKDAVLLRDLPAGAYTAAVSGAAGATGVALAEVYAVDDQASRGARLVNMSTRAFVGGGETVMIQGFVAGGSEGRALLVRAVGPTLSAPPFSVAGTLADPELRVYQAGRAASVAHNDDWMLGVQSGYESMGAIFARAGAFPFPSGSRDAALLLFALPNTPYTIVVSGKNGATGIALVEVYELIDP
jgi:hypothetical protein